MENFNDYEQQRYQRHLQLPGFGAHGQGRCRQAHVAIVGMGGLGCPVALYLAAAGVGSLSLIDADIVSLSNLQRQVLFTEDDIGTHKAKAAAKHLTARNSHTHITAHAVKLTPENALELLAEVDLVIDCSDNFYARYLINDTCYSMNKPWIYSSVLGQQGQVALFQPRHSCFRCLFPKLDSVPDCNQAGVLGVMPGMLGTMQASLALQYLAGVDLPVNNELHMVASWPFQLRTISLAQAPQCGLCQGLHTSEELARDYWPKPALLGAEHLVDIAQLATLSKHKDMQLVDVRSPQEHQLANLGGVNIPMDELPNSFTPRAGKTYVFYCQTGARSATAVSDLLSAFAGGLEIEFFSLEGGIAKVS